MDKYMYLQLALSAAILAMLVPLYHPLDHIQRLIDLTLVDRTPFGNSSDGELKVPKLETFMPKSRFMSYDPLIAHLEDFISYEERQYLLKLAGPLLEKSQVRLRNGTRVDSPNRTSSTAFLPNNNPVVKHVLLRASEFQGYIDTDQMDMQVTAYQPGQEYKGHYDWFPQPNESGRNRFSTFFAILEANCTNCGTEFLQIQIDAESLDTRWCTRINCTAENFTSLNKPGAALFWRNLDPWGIPRPDVMHAGLPAHDGVKIGLNIWTEIDVNGEWYDDDAEEEDYEYDYEEQEQAQEQEQGVCENRGNQLVLDSAVS
ncbi:hypothetical protein AC578_9385 [Pseudocercospora eumusae]|uniref:Prolyl 4-hydroxylase alpha subunit domain-containing protein n=1 Tax=Pseudocercospora eumusae TaxID=321146 RepID=A0A139H6R8_9PEZI|nr:hypothetical protein AC578_9385 [Pseudocercospora eumusae]